MSGCCLSVVGEMNACGDAGFSCGVASAVRDGERDAEVSVIGEAGEFTDVSGEGVVVSVVVVSTGVVGGEGAIRVGVATVERVDGGERAGVD